MKQNRKKNSLPAFLWRTLFIGVVVVAVATNSKSLFGQELLQKQEVSMLKQYADNGLAEAQFELGRLYVLGEGVPLDLAAAATWFRLAADQGMAEAQFELGRLYALGEGVPPDINEAAAWFRLAADQGLAEAQFELGKLYYFGRGVPPDFVAAAKHYRTAANQGLADAQLKLGLLYYRGEGVPRNNVQAYAWINIGTAQTGKNKGIEFQTLLSDILTNLSESMSRSDLANAQDLSQQYWEAYVENSNSSD